MQDYKSLCVAVTICATLVGPKFNVYILSSVTLKTGGESVSWCAHVSCTYDANLVNVGE